MTDGDNQGQPTEKAPGQPQETPRRGVDPVVTVSYFGPDGAALDRLPKHRVFQGQKSTVRARTGGYGVDPETSILFIGPNGEVLDKLPS